jgi:hypothetical protein
LAAPTAIMVSSVPHRQAIPITARNDGRASVMTIASGHPRRQRNAHQPPGALTHHRAGARTQRIEALVLRHVAGDFFRLRPTDDEDEPKEPR